MTDRFIDIILGALEKTDTSAVWSETDALSTVYRGKLPYVADAVQALFLNAYREGVHMALEGQFSKGCPGDVSGDSVLDREGEAPNAAAVQGIHFPRALQAGALPPSGPPITSTRSPKSGTWRRTPGSTLSPSTTPPASRATCRRCSAICTTCAK